MSPSPVSPAASTLPFLLEVGVEELPSGAVAPAVAQLKDALLARLGEARLAPASPDAVQTFATPRRLSLLIPDLPAQQPDAQFEVRGPNIKAAFDANNAPTKAAQGFAAKNGVPVESLVVVGEYVTATRHEAGKPTGDVLAQIIPDVLKTLTFPKFMRWGTGTYRFGRPLRRLVALLGADIVPFEVEGVSSGRETVGHRFLSHAPVQISQPADYADALRAAFVEPDPAVRRERIIEGSQKLAQAVGGTAVLPDALVDENTYLTEWVTGVLGNFESDYLSLPRPVLETAMKKHQRFFPVEGADGNLLPHFIAIRSGSDAHLPTVQAGYEAVLGSRFNDARFFFDHDKASSLFDKTPKTERIVFQEKLGTLFDKTKRIAAIMEQTHLTGWTHDAVHARRAVELSKTDLATEIVAELPALQGVMGREFARMDNEPEAVAVALFEQYLPRTAGDELPHGRIGTALSLADRVDTLVGYLTFVGTEPKGSSDPFGLKRAASAIVDILARDRSLPNLSVLLGATQAAYEAQGLQKAAKPGDLQSLFAARLHGVLEERGIRYDLIDALLAAPWDNIASVIKRGDVLGAMLIGAEEIAVVQTATRIRNILKNVKEPIADAPNIAHLTAPEERTVHAFLQTVVPQVERDLANGEYTDALDTLAALANPVSRLFDHVMIMADDLDVRASRLALLARADRLFLKLADFSQLVQE